MSKWGPTAVIVVLELVKEPSRQVIGAERPVGGTEIMSSQRAWKGMGTLPGGLNLTALA